MLCDVSKEPIVVEITSKKKKSLVENVISELRICLVLSIQDLKFIYVSISE